MRSRLEVRWALFFDSLGYANRYEPDFLMPIPPYQPDFALDDFGVAVEIKHAPRVPLPPHDDLLVWEQFLGRLEQLDAEHERWQAFVDASDMDLWVCLGQPVVWIEGRPARPAAVLLYRPHRPRSLTVWSEGEQSSPIPKGSIANGRIGPMMMRAAEAIRDYDFLNDAA